VGVGAQVGAGETEVTYDHTYGGGTTTSISVKFDEKLLASWKGEYLVAHEGAHVFDDRAYGDALAKDFSKAFGGPLDITRLAAETHGFLITSYLLQANGTEGSKLGATVWQNSWRKVDATIPINRATAIADYIRNTPAYGYYDDPAKPYMAGSKLSSRVTSHQ
jgi:hypothetical protein